jgi:uncharacterized BrkB/YihY/UPF0761 family membrane protein
VELEEESSASAMLVNKQPTARTLNDKLTKKRESRLFIYFPTRRATVLSFTSILSGFAATFAFTRVFSFAPVVTGFASALSLASILPAATVFAFILVGQSRRRGG